jgi:hypothetical protein
MIKQTGRFLALLMVLLVTAPLSAEIYRVVDKDGNVIYTDQPPDDGSEPMDLPELSVIQSDTPEAAADEDGTLQKEESAEPKAAELRKMYGDFRILQPQDEETFWGTANQVTVSWGGTAPLQPGMTVRLIVDGSPVDVTGKDSVSLRLDRGEHVVRVELFSGGKRPFLTTQPVTFYVKQASIGQIGGPEIADGL